MQLHYGEEPHAHVHIRRECFMPAILRLLEIYQISTKRMKAETLSWSGGCLSRKRDLVHKTRQRYDFKLTQQNNCGKYYLILIKCHFLQKTPRHVWPYSELCLTLFRH